MITVVVYWDNQDRFNEGWAYRAHGDHVSASGGVDANDLKGAVEWTIMELGLTIQESDFSYSQEEGGYAMWCNL